MASEEPNLPPTAVDPATPDSGDDTTPFGHDDDPSQKPTAAEGSTAGEDAGEGQHAQKETRTDDAAAEKAAEPEEPPMVTTGQLFRYADGCDMALMISGTIFAFLNGAGFPAFFEVFARMIEDLADNPPDVEDKVAEVALIMVYVGLIVMVLSALQTMTWMIAAERQISRIKSLYFSAMLRQDAAFYDDNKPGGLTGRLVGDTRVIKAGINDKVATGIMNFGMFVFGYGLGFYHSWKMTLVMMSTMPLVAGAAALMMVVMQAMSVRSREGFAEASSISEEVLQSIRTVQIFGGEKREVERFSSTLGKAASAGVKKEFAQAASMAVSYGLIFASYSLAFWYGGQLIADGEISIAEVISVFFSVLMGSFGLGLVFPTLGSLSESRGAAFKVYGIIERTPAIDPRIEGKKPEKLEGSIEFSNVAFSYPTRRDTKLFTNLTLRVEAGQTVAFSGASGCGKSSLIALVQRLYDPDAGEVRVDGTPLRELDLTWWREQVGVVQQEPALFGGTILDNVRMGKPDATLEEVKEACRQANVSETIERLPDQYDTRIGAVGSQLSGGQKQRLAIARAIIKRPRLLILDEATSALDRKSEAEVQEALDKIMKGDLGQRLTVLVIAHRLTTIRHADVIHFVTHDDVDGSVIAESGSYESLMERQGLFSLMVKKQQVSAQAAEEDAEAEEGAAEDNDSSHGAPARSPFVGKAAPGTPGTPGSGNGSFAVAVQKKATLEDAAKQEEKATEVPMMRIVRLTSGKTWSVFVGMVGSVMVGGAYPAYAVLFGNLMEVLGTKTGEEIKDETPLWASLFVALGVWLFVGWTLQGFYAIAGEHVTQQLRASLFGNIVRQDQTFFDTPGRDVGSLGAVLGGETEAVHMLFGPALGYKVQAAVNLVVGMAVAFIYQWKLALVTIAVIPVMVLSAAINQMVMMTGVDSNEEEDEVSAAAEKKEDVVAESMTNIRTVMAFNLADRQIRRHDDAIGKDLSRGQAIGFIAGIAFGLSQFTFYGAFALAFWYGGKLMQDGEATFKEVNIASMAILMGAMGAGEAGGFMSKTADAARAAKRVFALMDHQPGIDIEREGTKDIGEGAALEFEHVKFIYPARPGVVVLRNFCNEFKSGNSVGLMGSTGCGKSTIIQMLGRFYDPVSGSVSVNGTDLRGVDLQYWRSQVSAVLQEPSLFSGTVRENIRYGVPTATDDDVEAVARLAAVHEDVLAMEKGYETDVGYKGRMLSGGQKQRVAIARALLRKPRLLLLDEATSALDNATEAAVMEGLSAHVKANPMTIVSVAHRLTTIQNSSKIVLLDDGVVLEQGTHEELVERKAHYAQRWAQYHAASN